MIDKLYYEANGISLFCGDCVSIVPTLCPVDLVVADPPYGETNLHWDKWPEGWPVVMQSVAKQMWCFGSFKMFMIHAAELAGWTIAQDVIWEKHNGSGMHKDRFRRVHEHAVHFYQEDWSSLYKNPPVVTVQEDRRRERLLRSANPAHWKGIANSTYEYSGRRLMRSVIYARSCHGHAVNETQKPESVVAPLLDYSVPKGGIVLDPFAGSGTVLAVARAKGLRAIGIEKRESQCAEIVRRLQQGVLKV